jgi:hypothetical protein
MLFSIAEPYSAMKKSGTNLFAILVETKNKQV